NSSEVSINESQLRCTKINPTANNNGINTTSGNNQSITVKVTNSQIVDYTFGINCTGDTDLFIENAQLAIVTNINLGESTSIAIFANGTNNSIIRNIQILNYYRGIQADSGNSMILENFIAFRPSSNGFDTNRA